MSRRCTAGRDRLGAFGQAAFIGVGKAQQNGGDVTGIERGIKRADERRCVFEDRRDEIESRDGALRFYSRRPRENGDP